MRSKNILSGLALSLSLLCVPALSPAADAPVKADPAKPAPAAQARADKANLPQGVEQSTLTIMPPTEDIIISFPLMLVERGTVESVDASAGTFELKRKDGSLARIKVGDNTIMDNVYADIFTRESKKGINDLKKGDRVRARVWPAQNGTESAVLVDVFHL